jgi:hypothetical protein
VNPPFSQYREWLASPEYKAQIARLLAEKPRPPRQDWPVNVGELIDRHHAHASMCIEAAARHMREAERLANKETKP